LSRQKRFNNMDRERLEHLQAEIDRDYKKLMDKVAK
jgi:hypothetical protein